MHLHTKTYREVTARLAFGMVFAFLAGHIALIGISEWKGVSVFLETLIAMLMALIAGRNAGRNGA